MYIGSQLFINSDDTPEKVKRWVKIMAENELTMIRLFMVWDQLEPREGEWSFHNYDACFEAAAQNRMIVVPTLMSVSPPGWMKITGGPQSIGPLENSSFWERSLESVEKIVKRYAKDPALNSWILWNEPDYEPPRSEDTLVHYRSYLEKSYGRDLKALNAHRYQPVSSFKDISFDVLGSNEQAFSSHGEKVDWIRFCEAFLLDRITQIRDRVRKYDTIHPCHLNPHNLGRNNLGQNPWAEAEIVDFLGCSSHPPWHSLRYGEERLTDSIAFFGDFIRGASPHRHWVSELQGGPTVNSALHPSCPTPADITLWLTESFATGAEATLFWCFNTRNDGFEAGEWGLLGPHDRQTPRLEAVRDFGKLVSKHRSFLEELKAPEPDAWILVSEDTLRLGWVEGLGETGTRNIHAALDAISGAHFALSDLGLTVGFLSETQLAKTQPSGRCLVLPNLAVLSTATLECLPKWITEGVHLIADGWMGAKDPWGKLSTEHLLKVEELFGYSMSDFEGLQSSKELSCDSLTAPTQWVRYILEPHQNSATLSRHEDGRPAINLRHTPEAKALYLGSHVFSEYLSVQDSWRPLLSHIFKKHLDISVEQAPHRTLIRTLPGKNASLLIVANRSQNEERIPLEISALEPLELGQQDPISVEGGKIVLRPKEVRLFKQSHSS